MNPRHVKALAVGASAALAYLSGAKVRDTMPVRGTTLAMLATIAAAATMAARNTAVTYETRNRLDDFLNGAQDGSGSHIHGHLNVHGDHNVTGNHTVDGNGHTKGDHTIDGRTTHGGTTDFQKNRISGLNSVNDNRDVVLDQDGGLAFNGTRRAIWMNGGDIYLGGGTVHP